MGRMEGKVVIVTGGTRGMGEAEVRGLVAEGDKIIRWSDYYDSSEYKYGRALPRKPSIRKLMKMFGALHAKGITMRTRLWDFAEERFWGKSR